MNKTKNSFILIIYFSIFFIILLITSIDGYVLLQLKQFDNSTNNDYSSELLINNLFSQYYSFLNVGNPPQKTEIQISSQDYGLIMEENICLTSYYYDKSKSLSLNEIYYTNLNQTIVVNETIIFPIFNSTSNHITYKTIPNYNFIYYKSNENKEKACIILGFKLMCPVGMSICNNISGYLKKNELTNSHNFLFLFYNNKEKKENEGYDAGIIIGENPHEFNNEKYHEKNYKRAKTTFWLGELTWTLRFKNYYYYNGEQINFSFNKKDELIHGIFLFNLEFIIGTSDYFQSIKLNYFDKYKKECNTNLVDSHYSVIACSKNFNTEKFPTLYFYHIDYNYTFELTHKELFQIRGDKKYFLIIFDSDSNYPWKFGKIFMQKYLFNFETDSRHIGFYIDLNYDEEEENKNNSNIKDNKNESLNLYLLIVLGVLLLIIIGFGCFFLGKFVYDKNRKKRANELDDEYEYKQKNNEEYLTNNSNKNNLGIN